MILRKIYYTLSPRLRFLIRRLYYLPYDIWTGISRKRHIYEPPKGKIFVGSGDFIGQGRHQVKLLKKWAELNSDGCVLDVGCGVGRTATALTEYLLPEGKYFGFDVVKQGVKWCQSKIGKDFPNFEFRYTPLHNDLYNKAENHSNQYQFPYTDNQFDCVFLFSVFTHMLPEETGHYLKEINRVLKNGQFCLATFFIIPDEDIAFYQKQNKFKFPYRKKGYLLMDSKVQSANVAITESYLEKIINLSHLQIHKQIPGYWKGSIAQSEDRDFQDIIVLKKL